MKIIIVGIGKVGYAIARQLSAEAHDITMVDSNPVALSRADSTLDVMVLSGNGASISVLVSAGVRDADLVIAVTDSDETNLVCCLIAKRLGAQHTVARVRNPEYHADAKLLRREIGLDMVINPDLEAAQEISRILSFPAAFRVEPFARGRIDMIGFQVIDGDEIAGVPLCELTQERRAEVLICAAEREGNYIIPRGDFAPQVGDNIYMVGTGAELQKMLKSIGRKWQKVKTVSAIGGSRIAEYLAPALKKIGASLRIVENNSEKCQKLAAKLPDTMIIHGDGSDQVLLQEENIFGADALVALTGRDEENLLMAFSAQRSGVGKVLVKMSRPNYMELVKETSIASIISPKSIIANQITRYVRALANSQGSSVERLYQMFGGAVEALEFIVSAESEFVNIPLKDLHLKSGTLLAAIAREDEILIPGGSTCIQPGDRVVVVTSRQELHDLKDILA